MKFTFKVLITTSGIGSRLGEFTKYTNKALLRVGEKPVISHIIDRYPENTCFVITLGYFGDQIRDFLEIAYPNRNFEFVNVANFQGEGSSLLLSMSCAKDKLQTPFIFHASDTIILDELPDPVFNWNAGYRGDGSSNYTSFDVTGDNISIFHDKGNMTPDFLHIGIVGINNYELFWDIASKILNERKSDSTLSDVDVLKEYIKTKSVRNIEIKSWFDIGNVEKIKEAKSFFAKKDFHVLDKVTESIYNVDGHVIKFFYDQQISKNRVERTDFLKGAVPEVISSRPNFYKYEYVRGDLYSNIANISNFHLFLNWAKSNLWKPVNTIDREHFKNIIFDFYYNKTIKRISDFQKSRSVTDKEDIINGQKIPTLKALIEKIDFNNLCNSHPTTFHGDFILDNVIYQGNGEFKLIDWRQDFGGEIEGGDMYYDLAKLSHNLVVNHQIIDDNNFNYAINSSGEISVNIHRLNSLVECEKQYYDHLELQGIDIRKVKLLRSIIWLNMSPLHHHPFDMFLYYFGKYTLFNLLNNQ
jgi:NDP-sugar pyrophosphorylase family protein